jgi:hypothetical protein
MNYLEKLVTDIELHSAEGIKECFANGVDPNQLFRGVPLIYELTSEYTRSSRFSDCVKAFVDAGLKFDDKPLLAVLLNDSAGLEKQLIKDPAIIHRKYSLRCAYTPLHEVTLLHVCAEFNHVACARVLVSRGADVNAAAGFDENGFGGHTPIFHTVNQNSNQSADMLDFLIENSADLLVTEPGFIWGKGYEWETLIPAVNPVSYAMMGLIPQMHRNEVNISKVVTRLLKKAYGIDYSPSNVPCAYLK